MGIDAGFNPSPIPPAVRVGDIVLVQKREDELNEESGNYWPALVIDRLPSNEGELAIDEPRLPFGYYLMLHVFGRTLTPFQKDNDLHGGIFPYAGGRYVAAPDHWITRGQVYGDVRASDGLPF